MSLWDDFLLAKQKTLKKSKTLGLSSAPHRKRYSQVLKVLTKYGLDEFLISSKGKKLVKITPRTDHKTDIDGLSRPERVRLALEELDGAFIKIAQILSNRPDIVPPEYLKELEKLQDNVPPFSSDEAIDIIESELEDKLYNLFMMFDSTPLASGSIAQIHKAVHFDGTPVVVKVRRPGIEEKFRIDIDIFTYLAYQTSKIDILKSQFKEGNPVEELSKEIYRELDFENELVNMKTFAKKMGEDDQIYVPMSFSSYSTEKVLTMEYINGLKVTELEGYTKYDIDPEDIANKLIDTGLSQIFDHRYFHGDPHPGNILVLEDSRICFLDFGLMGRITSRQRETIVDLVTAYARNDYIKLSRIVMKFAPKDQYIDEDKLEGEIAALLDKYRDVELKEINVGEALTEIIDFILSYNITLNFNTYLLIKSLSSYEGIGKRIYPEFELTPHAEKFTKKLIRENFNPKKVAQDIYISSTDLLSLARDLPNEVVELLNTLNGGRLRANVGFIGLNDTIDYTFKKLNSIVNRIIVTVIIAALLLSSSIVLNIHPGLGSDLVILFAGLGFITSMILAFWIVISMLRNRQ